MSSMDHPIPARNAVRNERVERNARFPFPFREIRIWNGRAVPEALKAGTVAFLGNFGRAGLSGTAYGMERPLPVPEMAYGMPPFRSPFREFPPEQTGTEQGDL